MESRFYRLKMRPGAEPAVPLVLNARSVGQCRRGPEYDDAPPRKDFVQLLWSVNGRGEILIKGRFHEFPAGHVACYHALEGRRWRSGSDPWHVRWLTADGPAAGAAFSLFGIGRPPHPAGPCPQRLFAMLEREITGFTPASACRASALVYEILCHAAGNTARQGQRDSLSGRCIELIRQHVSEWKLNVDWLSGTLGKNRSVLSRVFRRETGLSPVDYINAMRMQLAVSLLQAGGRSVADIARQCGFVDTGYFCRRFKKQMGVSPGVFKRTQQD